MPTMAERIGAALCFSVIARDGLERRGWTAEGQFGGIRRVHMTGGVQFIGHQVALRTLHSSRARIFKQVRCVSSVSAGLRVGVTCQIVRRCSHKFWGAGVRWKIAAVTRTAFILRSKAVVFT